MNGLKAKSGCGAGAETHCTASATVIEQATNAATFPVLCCYHGRTRYFILEKYKNFTMYSTYLCNLYFYCFFFVFFSFLFSESGSLAAKRRLLQE